MKALLILAAGKFSRWIRDVLSTEGNQSTTRLVLLATWGTILLVWGVLSLSERKLLDIPRSVLELAGIITLGKCWQNHLEAKEPTS